MLHPELARVIKETQRQHLEEGKLFSAEKLHGYYAVFRERFGPEVLQKLDGELLLTTMHDLRRENRNSLVYWLEFKNDDEFPALFGSISGGSALKFGVYPNAATGKWMTRDRRNVPVEISLNQAIDIARRHRDELLRGVALLDALPANATDDVYAQLQHSLDDQLPSVGITAWGHKYLSLLFPDKLDDYHMPSYQRFHLVKLLEPNLPDERAGRFITAGRFVRVAHELDMPINHLTTVLNQLHGKPYRYWSIVATDPGSSVELDLHHQVEGGFAAISWAELGDLSHLVGKNDSRVLLRQSMEAIYPAAKNRDRKGIHNFVTEIAVNDRVVLYEPRSRKVVAIGTVMGGYYFEDSLTRPHRIPVEWLSADEWQFADDEGFDAVTREIQLYSNQVEVERHLPEIVTTEHPTPVSLGAATHLSGSQNIPVRLTGISGRIQTILDRKSQVILYGPPGTGKTYWAETTACELSARQVFGKSYAKLNPQQRHRVFGSSTSTVQLCSFHPAYGYEDFLEGYRPQVVSDQMTFVRQSGIFKQLCELARKDENTHYYLIIDEINRGDIPRIFGELLTVLEKDKRGKAILLPISGTEFSVPSNVFVIGTMNTADRSIALLDAALRRRFGFIEVLPDPTVLRPTIIEGIPLGSWLEALNRRILQFIGRDARNLQIGHAYFLDNGKPITELAKLTRVLREDIIPLLEEYCYEDYAALRHILGAALVDETNQIIRQALFEPGNESNLVQALLEPTPDLTTLAMVTDADGDLVHNNAVFENTDVEEEFVMLELQMCEWERITYAENAALAKFSFGDDVGSRAIADRLAAAGILEIVELRQGLSIRTTSYVGRIQIGDLQVTIQPKIQIDVLSTLLRYAYKLRDLRLMTNTELDTEPYAFQDILIGQLISEVTQLVSRGLYQQYRRAEGSLAFSKGRIDIQNIARRASGIRSADIPVIHHPRIEDCLINQVLLAGINFAIPLTTDVTLQSRLRRLASVLELGVSSVKLNFGSLSRLRRELNRLTAPYAPSITLIELLMVSTGITLEAKDQQAALPGFLFDMNNFFERLLSRFLSDNLPDYTVHNQRQLTGMMAYSPQHNPKRRRSPTPRPDFVITNGDKLIGILDAKYRDLWEHSLPREMLYQLALYALSQGWNGRSIILYPCVNSSAVPQVIEISEPFADSSKARIILTPVNLHQLSELLQDTSVSARQRCVAYAENLVLGGLLTTS